MAEELNIWLRFDQHTAILVRCPAMGAKMDVRAALQLDQGDLADALKSYSDSLAIAERQGQSDPSNAGWQHDLAACYSKLASAFRKGEENAKALDALRQSRVIMERLTRLSPKNAV